MTMDQGRRQTRRGRAGVQAAHDGAHDDHRRPAPARPCTNRNAISTTMLGASEQSTEATAYVVSAASDRAAAGRRTVAERPDQQLGREPGPMTHAVNVSCTHRVAGVEVARELRERGRIHRDRQRAEAIARPDDEASPEPSTRLGGGRLRRDTKSAIVDPGGPQDGLKARLIQPGVGARRAPARTTGRGRRRSAAGVRRACPRPARSRRRRR